MFDVKSKSLKDIINLVKVIFVLERWLFFIYIYGNVIKSFMNMKFYVNFEIKLFICELLFN